MEQGANIIRQKIKGFSHKAGVYRMLDKEGQVLYVGKAKDLIHRLTNYTHPERLTYRIREMVSHVADVIVIETAGETAAFLLENELIKQYHPYYNILLKDDKSYPYIAISHDKYPRLFKYRGKRNKSMDYFGPFDSGDAVNKTIIELQKLFGLRNCKDSYFNNRTRPCLMYQIKRCLAPCCQKVSDIEYQRAVQNTKDFLNKKSNRLQEELQTQMLKLSQNQEYEAAAVIRDKITALNHIQGTSQHIPNVDTDTIAHAYQNGHLALQIFFHRTDRLTGHQEYLLNHIDPEELNETLDRLVLQLYTDVPPPQVICTTWPTNPILNDALRQMSGHKVESLNTTFRGIRREWMEHAQETAQKALNTEENKAQLWQKLAQFLNIRKFNRIDIFDNSHLSGTHAVGAIVSAGPMGFIKSKYRRYNIPMELAEDDFGMMMYVLYKRLQRNLSENDLPDALLLDGGKGQLSSVMKILNDLKIDIPVLAISKGAGQHDKGLETFYLSSDPTTPITLDFKGDLIHLLQNLRDEAHRFAIGSHRMKREKGMFHERLEDIEDIGPKRRKQLILHFGSMRAISGASLEQLQMVPGINQKIAKKIYTFLHNGGIK